MWSYRERRILDGIKAVRLNQICGPVSREGIFDFVMAIIYLDEVEMTEPFRKQLAEELKLLGELQGKDVADICLAIKEALDR